MGGFTIREAAAFDDSNNMIAVGKFTETYKPVASDGSTKDLYVKMILEVSNAASVTLMVNPTVIWATKNDINNLAGSARTNETVKKNADDISALKQDIEKEKADNMTQFNAINADITKLKRRIHLRVR